MHSSICSVYAARFDAHPEYLVSAPGRVNIIGEHTDYNNGFVLPCALHYKTEIAAAKRQDSKVCAYSLQYPDQREVFDIALPITHSQWPWGDYLRGVVNELINAGHKISGMNIVITSDVPQGCGLSSSAALEVAIGGLFNSAFELQLNKSQIAHIGQLAENNFIDCQCGIMDQLISAEAQRNAALLIDCENLSTRPISLPDKLALLVINSNYPRKLADSEYNQRRAACEQAAEVLGVSSLRHATLNMLEQSKAQLSDTIYRRAKHVITENTRVLDATQALESGDVASLYNIIYAAHLSLKNDFEITVPATDGLVDIVVNTLQGNGACRQTGGGFGGAVICLCDQRYVAKVISAVTQEYPAAFGLTADILICEPDKGLRVECISQASL